LPKLAAIGEGTYGVVYKARDTRTGEIIALKQVRMERERDTGMPITALREIKLLESLNHPHVVKLKEVVVGSKWDEIFLVFEYIEHDMADLLDAKTKPFVLSEIKTLIKQLLEAVSYMHMQWIIHRDIKVRLPKPSATPIVNPSLLDLTANLLDLTVDVELALFQ